jgi:hypothetical protein
MADTIELLRDSRTGRFLPGTAPPNPGGRPRNAINQVRALCQEHCVEAIDTLIKIMTNPEVRDRDRIAAAQTILERAIGKPIPENELMLNDQDGIEQRERILKAVPEEVRRRLIGAQ